MIRSVGFIMFMFAGCAAENPNDFNGGYVWYDHEQELPEGEGAEKEPPVCLEIPTPYEWEPAVCTKNDRGMCCQWKEFTEAMTCEYNWCYDLWECDWLHDTSRCEGDSL
jgi:hypothetical protein